MANINSSLFMTGIPCTSSLSRLQGCFHFFFFHANYFLCPKLNAFHVLSQGFINHSLQEEPASNQAFAQTRLFSNIAVKSVCTNTRRWQDQMDWADIEALILETRKKPFNTCSHILLLGICTTKYVWLWKSTIAFYWVKQAQWGLSCFHLGYVCNSTQLGWKSWPVSPKLNLMQLWWSCCPLLCGIKALVRPRKL